MIRILFLAANPQGTTPLGLDEECRAVDQALRRSEYREQFELRQHWAVRTTDLQELLLRYSPDIVHFTGHGTTASEIILQDNTGAIQPVSPRMLERLFSVLKDNVRCVVLNACYSQGQAEAIAQHLDCVVGMSKAIEDSAAVSFAAAFYQALGFGRDVQAAFELGCLQIDLDRLGESDSPRLIAKIRDPRQVRFAVAHESENPQAMGGFVFDQRGQKVKNQYFISGDMNMNKKQRE